MQRTLALYSLAVICLLMQPVRVGADTLWWDNEGAGSRWETPENWSLLDTPKSEDPTADQIRHSDVVFSRSDLTLPQHVVIGKFLYADPNDTDPFPNSITFQGPGQVQVEHRGEAPKLTIGSGGVNVTGGSPLLHVPIEVGSSQTWRVAENQTLSVGRTALQTLGLNDFSHLTIQANGSVSIASKLVGNGTLIKQGGGLLTLQGELSHTGPTIINEGTLKLPRVSSEIVLGVGTTLESTVTDLNVIGGKLRGRGSVDSTVRVQSGGLLAPGLGVGGQRQGDDSTGIITVNGDLVLEPEGTLEIKVGGVDVPGDDFDQVQVTGDAILDGTFEFPIINGFAPTVGDRIVFLEAASVTGAPKRILAPSLLEQNDQLALQVNVLPSMMGVEMLFVERGAAQFVDEKQTADWHLDTSWKGDVPTEQDFVTVNARFSGKGQSQELLVRSDDAPTHSLVVEDPQDPIVIRVIDNRELSASVGQIEIGQNAEIALGNGGSKGNLITPAEVRVRDGGTLSGNGEISNDQFDGGRVFVEQGTLRVEETDTLSILGSLNFTSDSVFEVTIADTNNFGRVEVLERSLAGTLRVELAPGAQPMAGNEFRVLDVSPDADMVPKIDEFDMEDLPILPGGNMLQVNYTANAVILQVLLVDFDGDGVATMKDIDALVAALASNSMDLSFDVNGDEVLDHGDLDDWLDVNGYAYGDANLDGFVDTTDFNAWQENSFQTHEVSKWRKADFNADGLTDGVDFLIWNENKTRPTTSAAVPEPCLAIQSCLWIIPWLLVRRRRV